MAELNLAAPLRQEARRAPGSLAAEVRLPVLVLLAAAAAALTVWLNGFVYGWSNNIFQIPFVERWFDEPAFADDTFVQTLRYFASWVWSFAALVAPAFGTEATVTGLHLVSRFLLLLTMALLLRHLGVRSIGALAAALLALAVTDALHRTSRVGGHDLYYWFFSHSGMTWPVILLSLLWLSQGRVVLAVASNGVTFGINGFIAVSHGIGLAAGALGLWPAERAGQRRLLLRWLAGLGLALLIGAPTLFWVYGMLATQPAAPPGFDGRDFLLNYWPEHFWVSDAPWRDQLWMAAAIVAGVAALLVLGPPARVLLAAFLGYVALFVASGLLPYVTSSLTLLNLHPLRISSGLVTMVAMLAAVAAATREAWTPGGGRLASLRRLLGAAALLCLGWGTLRTMLLAMVALAAILVLRRWEEGRWTALPGARLVERAAAAASAMPRLGAALPAAVMVLLASIAPVRHAGFAEAREERAAAQAAMREVGLWLAARTPADATVFVPAAAEPPHSHNIQVWAHRRFWYDWKRGGAVQWSPHYYEEWHARRMAARALTTVEAAMAHACRNGIGYLVETPERMADATPRGVAFRNARYAVIEVAPTCKR